MDMLPSKLLQFLAKNKSSSKDFSEIVSELTRQGWDQDTIKEAEKWYAKSPAINAMAGDPSLRDVAHDDLYENGEEKSKDIGLESKLASHISNALAESTRSISSAVSKSPVDKEPEKEIAPIQDLNEPKKPETDKVDISTPEPNLTPEEENKYRRQELAASYANTSRPPTEVGGFKRHSKKEEKIEPKVIDSKINIVPEIEKRKSDPNKIMFLLIFLGFAVILSALIVTTVMIAYGKISISNKSLQNKIEYAIQEIPFMPKTPSYLFTKMTMANSNITSLNIDASLALESNGLSSLFGNSQFDLAISGQVDLNNKDDLKTALNFKVQNNFDADLKLVSNMVFLKVNVVPPEISALAESLYKVELTTFLNRWFAYNITPLETEARDLLDEVPNDAPLTNGFLLNPDFIQTDIIDGFTVSKVDDNGVNAYELSKTLSESDLESLLRNLYGTSANTDSYGAYDLSHPSSLSPMPIKDTVIKIYIDEKSFYLRKLLVSFNVSSNSVSRPTKVLGLNTQDSFAYDYVDNEDIPALPTFPNLVSEDVDVVLIVRFSQFNETFDIVAPETYSTYEEFIAEFMALVGPSGVGQDLKPENLEDDFTVPDYYDIYKFDGYGIFPIPNMP